MTEHDPRDAARHGDDAYYERKKDGGLLDPVVDMGKAAVARERLAKARLEANEAKTALADAEAEVARYVTALRDAKGVMRHAKKNARIADRELNNAIAETLRVEWGIEDGLGDDPENLDAVASGEDPNL